VCALICSVTPSAAAPKPTAGTRLFLSTQAAASKLSTEQYKPLYKQQPREGHIFARKPIWHNGSSKPQLNSKSRRTSQRRKKRYLRSCNSEKSYSIKINQAIHFTKLRCLRDYSFFADPAKPLQQNFNKGIENAPSPVYCQPKNLTFHNLCQTQKLPIGTRNLLGLNLKFCLASTNLQNNINKTVLRMARSIRTSYFLKQHNLHANSNYEKQIYVKNLNWHPPPAPLRIKEKISSFEKLLKEKHAKLATKNRQRNLLNLTPLQKSTLQQLKANDKIIIKPTDKNLGPAVMDTNLYVQQILREHLLTQDYQQLTQKEAEHKMERLKTTLKNAIAFHSASLSAAEKTFFQRSLRTRLRLPIFYGLPKVHKSPVSLRPVVSSSSGLLTIFSTWLDYRMKELLPLIQSYTKNSFEVIKDLKNLTIPGNALLFSADAKSMYTNIDTATGLLTFKQFFEANSSSISPNFPVNLFLQILEIVMRNNIFSFSNTYWIQLSGTAMGTPAACSYATITYGHFENTEILTEFRPQILFYKRYIDDVFGLWIPPPTQQASTWAKFKEKLNSWGSLKWIIEEPSNKTIFLDLQIELKNGMVYTNTYQKHLNLYLYIPPRSAHPPSCLKGLISGELRRYWLQNSQSDFTTILTKFIQRLIDRGHSLADLTPIFHQAAIKINNTELHNVDKAHDNTLFIHWTFHPNGLQRRDIREIYDATLKKDLEYDKMTVAIARPRNLRDLLSSTSLITPPDINIQDSIAELRCTS
jgi:hypothetical protein